MKINVIITAYNHECFTINLVHLLSQIFRSFEIILVYNDDTFVNLGDC